MVSGYHFLPVAPASWRKTIPAAAVTSVNCRATGGDAGGAMAVTCGADLEDSCDFWESLHPMASRIRHTTLPTNPRRTMLPLTDSKASVMTLLRLLGGDETRVRCTSSPGSGMEQRGKP